MNLLSHITRPPCIHRRSRSFETRLQVASRFLNWPRCASRVVRSKRGIFSHLVQSRPKCCSISWTRLLKKEFSELVAELGEQKEKAPFCCKTPLIFTPQKYLGQTWDERVSRATVIQSDCSILSLRENMAPWYQLHRANLLPSRKKRSETTLSSQEWMWMR